MQVFPLVGLPQFNGWSQVLVEHDQRLMCAIGVEGQNAGNIGRDLVLQVEHAVLDSAADFYNLLQQLVKTTEELEVKLLVAATFVEDSQVTFATYNGTIILKRQTKVGNLLTSGETLKVIQGSLEINDLLVLATNAVQSYFGELQQKAGQGYEAEIIMNSMVSAIHDDPTSASMSLAFLALPEPETERPVLTPPLTEVEPPDLNSAPLQEPGMAFFAPLTQAAADLKQESADQAAAIDTQTLAMVPTQKKAYTPWRQRWRQGQLTAWKIARHAKPWLRRVAEQLGQVFGGVRNLTSQVKKKPFLSSEVYISHSPQRPWRLILVIGGMIVLVIAGISFWRSRQAQQLQAAELALEPLVTRFVTAESQVAADPVTARAEMQTLLTETETLKNNFQGRGAGQRLIIEQLAEFQTRYDSLSGKAEFSELPVFFDLTMVQGDFVASQVVSNGTTAVFIDTDNQHAISLDLSTLQPKEFTLNDVPRISDSALQNNQLLVLGGGVSGFDLAQENPSRIQIIAEGDSNREAQLLNSFSDYLYVFNPSKRNIYRYLRSDDSVSEPIGWLKPGQNVTFEDVESIRVDGDVWLGTRSGEIVKLSLGERADFVVTGLSEPFASSLLIDTQPDWQNLYVLEPSARRVVVLSKEGTFLKEVKSASLASATQLIADEAGNRVLAVSGSVV
ncbi:MAG: hypothetical protein JNK33_05790, partial [Candidatus Doudnabacteria bacterium]|nr:hypothetical protein [Candidatus Doudnabacteria bacterium]